MANKKQGIKLTYNGLTREYGGHSYPTSNQKVKCDHGCGCWKLGVTVVGGPAGIHPLGACPGNTVSNHSPKNVEAETDFIIRARIQMAEQKLMVAGKILSDLEVSLTSWSAGI